ncbi:MAG: PEP-CTERM sorting domain-containing protein [Fimbriimonadaceae bacterium]
MKLILTIAGAGLCASSFAQFSDNFESETGSAAGTLLTSGFGGGGQGGWYNPVSGSIDGKVYTYSGNALGLSADPNGGNQFLGMHVLTAQGSNRAQHSVAFTSGLWTIGFDFNGMFSGTLPAADNLGSVSLQPAASNYFQTIYQWGTNTATAKAFNANIGHFASTGGSIVFDSPGAAWTNLTVNHWYHQTVTWNFTTGLITDTTLTDITAGGATNDFQPTGWYLAGGANNAGALITPTDVRFFASGAAGDIMGYDNLTVTPAPEPASMAVLALGAVSLLRRRRKA